MKKYNVLILMLLLLLSITSCNKQKKNLVTTSNKEEVENELIVIPGKNGQPDEADIASGHKINIQDWFMKDMSSDGKYYIRYNSEYYYTYDRYCIPVEGERKDLNLIMLKEKSEIFNPSDMGEKDKDVCFSGCEFVPIARSKDLILFNEKESYWFKISENKWLPGVSVYIQPGTFEKLPVEELEVGMAYEKIKDGAWFVVKTDEESSFPLRDSSDIKTGKDILTISQGTWLYADAQTIKTETIDGVEARWYKIIYPEKGYVFGGYLEKQDDVCGLSFAQFDVMHYHHDGSNNYTFKVYSAPTTKSQYLGEYEIKPDEYGYLALIETKKLETVDGVQGVWINIKEPVKGFIFGYNFIYK